MIRVPSGRAVLDESALVTAVRSNGDRFDRQCTIQMTMTCDDGYTLASINYATDTPDKEDEVKHFENDWEFISKVRMDELEDDD
jgi:hypothetical protein